jgi:hypothetical protein
MEDRIRFVDYKGKRILLEDFSNILDEDELIRLIEKAGKVVQSQAKGSVLVVVDLTNSRYSPRVTQESKQIAAGNTPYIHASTLVGVKGLMDIVVRGINAFTGRKLMVFGSREEAMEWLIKQ